jgi:hypothetical protein
MNILKAISLIVVGVFFTYYTYKHPNKTFPTKDIGGYIGGITFIVLGILVLFGKIKL